MEMGGVGFWGGMKNGGRDTVRAKNDPFAGRNLVQILDKNNPALAEIIDHIRIVDDLVVDIKRRPVFGQGQLHNINSKGNAGTEALCFC